MSTIKTMQLDQALDIIPHYGVLTYDERLGCDLWTSVNKAPIALRRTIYRHRAQLVDMMRDGDIRVCPARTYHRQYWRWQPSEKRYICEMCIQLDAHIGMLGQDGNLSC